MKSTLESMRECMYMYIYMRERWIKDGRVCFSLRVLLEGIG